MFKFAKKFALSALAIAVMAMSTVPLAAAAATTTSTDTGTGSVQTTIPITGTIQPLVISVTHPISEAYAIDPNAGSFTAPDVTLTNSTKVPVTVTVQALSSASGGSIQFQDVAPTAESWNALSASDSKKYIALGVGISNNTGWNSGYNTSTDWAASGTSVLFGSVNSGASANMSLTAKYGTAFDGSYTAKHNLVFVFQLQ